MARQRGRWPAALCQILRTGANPSGSKRAEPVQRIAYLEGILHWFST